MIPFAFQEVTASATVHPSPDTGKPVVKLSIDLQARLELQLAPEVLEALKASALEGAKAASNRGSFMAYPLLNASIGVVSTQCARVGNGC
jgi:hypothetical protein